MHPGALQKSPLTPLYKREVGRGLGWENLRGLRVWALSPNWQRGIVSPFLKGGRRRPARRGFGQTCSVLADASTRAYSYATNSPQYANTASAGCIRVLCKNPPSPPFTKGGNVPALAERFCVG